MDIRLYQGYTMIMKTAISIPDQLFNEAEKTAKSMGIPRSQLYTKAIEAFLDNRKQSNLTEKLNEIYGKSNSKSDLLGTEIAGMETVRELTKNDAW